MTLLSNVVKIFGTVIFSSLKDFPLRRPGKMIFEHKVIKMRTVRKFVTKITKKQELFLDDV